MHAAAIVHPANTAHPALTPALLAQCAASLGGSRPPEVAAWQQLSLDSSNAPWTASAITLAAGQSVSWFCCGSTRLTALPQISVPARFQLWGRVGNGTVLRGTRGSHTFTAEAPGRLELASYFPGEWSTPNGDCAVPPEAYGLVEGTLEVLLVAWAPGVSVAQGLAALAALDDSGLAALEMARREGTEATPAGWDYLWFLGPSETFRTPTHDDTHCITCDTHEDAAILHHDADLPLLPGTQLRWRWRVDALPSAVAEDTLPTHDYLSIAVEFDNGLDLTYMWSVNLPVGTVFRCPLPNWDARETHAVVRSGTADLGTWLSEERDVYADYQAMIAPGSSAPEPTRVRRVWLIAVSLFQKGTGACRYADIEVANAAGAVRVA